MIKSNPPQPLSLCGVPPPGVSWLKVSNSTLSAFLFVSWFFSDIFVLYFLWTVVCLFAFLYFCLLIPVQVWQAATEDERSRCFQKKKVTSKSAPWISVLESLRQNLKIIVSFSKYQKVCPQYDLVLIITLISLSREEQASDWTWIEDKKRELDVSYIKIFKYSKNWMYLIFQF